MNEPIPNRVPVSIVCVARDPGVRESNLDRSIADHLHEAPDTEYLPLDNSTGAFRSCGQAFNHAAAIARNEILVFVHADVYIHSLRALERMAAFMAQQPDIGVHGSAGIAADGRIVGCMRDRVVVLGERVDEPADVDSLDEVLFMASRRQVLEEPIVDIPELAWHAYAVEYGVRVRAQGKRVTAGGIPLTHNSLDVNLQDHSLADAHRAIARLHPSSLPVRTTCGVIAARPRRQGLLRAHRWRYRWLRESRVAHSARRAVGGGPVVLSDIRVDVDEAAAVSDGVLEIVNVERDPAAARDPQSGRLEIVRRGRTVSVESLPAAELAGALSAMEPGRAVLFTGLAVPDLHQLRDLLPAERLVGYHESIGCWILLGEPARKPVAEPFGSPRSTPLGMARVRAA
jgi:Glycosyltransferase like family